MATEAIAAVTAVILQKLLSPIPEVSTTKVLSSYIIVNVGLLLYILKAGSESTLSVESGPNIPRLNAIFLSTAIVSTAVHRLFFSPLSSFPGPKLAALSKLWGANEARHGRTTETLRALHKKYNAEIIRTGPNEVSINNADAISKIFRGKYPRGSFYELRATNGELNINTTRDYAKHGPWRKAWEKAFSKREFPNYHRSIEYHVAKLVNLIKNKSSESGGVEFSGLMIGVLYDIMMDIGLGKDSGVQDGRTHPFFVQFIHKYLRAVAILSNLRNLGEIFACLPNIPDVKRLRARATELVSERSAKAATQKDMFEHLLNPSPDMGVKFTPDDLTSNLILLMAGGIDTVSVATAQTIWFLVKDPPRPREAEGGNRHGVLPYLNGVVNEGLRLGNPVPGGAYAVTPAEGLELGSSYIPGHVEVKISVDILMSDPRYFPQGECFIPERWTEESPELILDRRAYIPFGTGHHSCPGRQVALNEMRLILARLVREFNILPFEGYDEKRFLEERKDYLPVQLKSLWVNFVPRGKMDLMVVRYGRSI
ncbi:cytochrome P450 [Penicillium malachiteum]|uniref:cytochrome P450 n=1 Tax=Penicillium malachiteum TaxID=1324776 RepID=UPI002546A9A9|nr:cytochrome P450 [Penicillium malachiteum]KAJ5729914.1 cytochrome P450 [Penicillium malachiteum]